MADDDFTIDPSVFPTLPQTQLPRVTVQDLSALLKSGPAIPQSVPQTNAQTYDSLAQARSNFSQELSDPERRRLLMASTAAEVGGQGSAATQAYMESVMNRANAEGRSLTDVLLDQKYYPDTTKNRLGRNFSDSEVAQYAPIINSVLAGSNISNLGTGNESGRVRSGGAGITFNPGTGERFVAENWTTNWRNRQMQALAQANIPNQQVAAVTQPQTMTASDLLRQYGF